LIDKMSYTEPTSGREDRARGRPGLGSALLAVLLFSEVASAILGAGTVLFACIVLAWLVLPAVVGFENVLDAGCVFMLVSLGIVVVVHAAMHGPLAVLP